MKKNQPTARTPNIKELTKEDLDTRAFHLQIRKRIIQTLGQTTRILEVIKEAGMV